MVKRGRNFTKKKTLTENLIMIISAKKASINNVSCHKTLSNKNMEVYPISDEKFVQSLLALKRNIFAPILNWEYERIDDSVFGEFMIYCNLYNMDFGTAYVAHMRVENDINVADVEKILLIENI